MQEYCQKCGKPCDRRHKSSYIPFTTGDGKPPRLYLCDECAKTDYGLFGVIIVPIQVIRLLFKIIIPVIKYCYRAIELVFMNKWVWTICTLGGSWIVWKMLNDIYVSETKKREALKWLFLLFLWSAIILLIPFIESELEKSGFMKSTSTVEQSHKESSKDVNELPPLEMNIGATNATANSEVQPTTESAIKTHGVE